MRHGIVRLVVQRIGGKHEKRLDKRCARYAKLLLDWPTISMVWRNRRADERLATIENNACKRGQAGVSPC